MQLKTSVLFSLLSLTALISAHPGEHEDVDHDVVLARRDFTAKARSSLGACADKLEKKGVNARARARRAATAEKHSKKSLKRDPGEILNKTHHSTENYDLSTSTDVLFASNATCILNPEGDIGPFWVKGEYIRTDLIDGQEGVPVYLDGQFVDIETCEPIEDLYWDIWNCNTTGVYSGIYSNNNGNGDDAANINATFLRGIVKTDEDGVAQFKTLFPGHYQGRTTHYHVIAYVNATLLPNNTLSGGTISHVGQLFWDQDLIDEVEATSPYNTNTQRLTTNAEDGILNREIQTDSDPFFEWVYLGDTVEDGIFGWITMAINTSASYDPRYSFALTEAGGVAESGGSSQGGGGGGGGRPPNGTFPGFPSGTGGPRPTST